MVQSGLDLGWVAPQVTHVGAILVAVRLGCGSWHACSSTSRESSTAVSEPLRGIGERIEAIANEPGVRQAG
jgi:hypothetical protein